MADLAKLVVKLEAQTARYQSELERAQRKNAQFSRNTRKSMDAVKGSFLAMAAGVVGAFATIRKGIDRQADLFDLSQRLGATSEGLSRLQYAAEQSGVSVQTLNMGLQRMVRRVAEAAAGTGEAKGALEELNISAEALNRLQPEKQFQVLADAIIAVENPADRVRLAMKLFDSEGVSLIQTMQGGSEAIRAMGSEADRLGLTVGTSAAAAAKQASDAFTRLSGVFTGAANALATQFAPELTLMAEFLTDNLPSAVGFTRKAFLALQRGAVNVALQFVKVRAAFNDLVGDTAQADQLRASAAILQQMVADLGAQAAGLGASTDVTVEYGDATERATYALQNFSNASNVAAQASEKKAMADRAALEAVIRSLETEEEALKRSYDERSRIILESTEITERQRQELMARLLDDTLQEVEVKAKRVKRSIQEDSETQAQAFDRIFGAGALAQLFSDLDNIEERFKALLANIAAQAAASGIASIFSGGSFSGGIGDFFGGLFGGGKAMGGPVTAGVPYMVGERGPELFLPAVSGQIVPNDRMGGTTVNMTVVTPNADSFRRSEGQIGQQAAKEIRRAGRNF
jgi:hypothetical protein